MASEQSQAETSPPALVTDQPLVSVAVITYNQRQFLEECIESVLAQDYSNIEIVVADDASTDGTVEMLRRYDAEYPGKFRLVLSERNRGITPNSNAAHFACNGKYIAWMGGDDLMLPGKISTQVAFMESHPECSICYHDLEVFDSDTGRLLYHYSQQQQPRTGGLREVIRFSTFNGACSNMVRRSAAPAHGFDNRFPVASDWLYWIETLSGGGRIEYLDHVLGRYRRHAGNVTGEPGINRAYLDHIATCVVLLIMFPHLQRDVRQILSDNLYGNRGASQEATLGWLSLGVHFRFGRLRCLLREWARRRLMTR